MLLLPFLLVLCFCPLASLLFVGYGGMVSISTDSVSLTVHGVAVRVTMAATVRVAMETDILCLRLVFNIIIWQAL